MLTKDILLEIAPKAKDADALFATMEEMLPKYEINTAERIAGFLAQCGHESGGFTVRTENLNYSAKALNSIFGKYFAKAGRDAEEYARKPEKIANVVYANRMDNGDTASGDGWRFRGRGYIQLTGRHNYTKFAESIGKDVDDVIEYLDTVEGALESACWFWKTNGLNAIADSGDIVKMTKRINGGTIGLEDRKKHWEHAIELLSGGHAPAPKKAAAPKKAKGRTDVTLSVGDRGDDVADMQRALGLNGDGIFGPGTKRSVKEFQQANGLTADGVAGPMTLTKLYE